MENIIDIVYKALEDGNGILRLKPAWVARDFLPPGMRLGLKESEYNVGERGWISERWLASTTKADNLVGPPDEGLSYINLDDRAKITLKEAVEVAGDLIMGKEYAKTHKGLGRLAKIYDFAARIPYHIHQMEKDARLVGRNPKEEAYYFPEGVDLGPHPETFFGVHPYIAREKKYDILLPYLEEWNSDLILKHSRAYLNVPGEGFHLPAGVLHAPGTALTIELQEDSDVFAMLQALVAGKIISKELLFKDVRKEDREKYGEKVILDQINWEISADPFFYENRHLTPILIEETRQDGGEEYWIYYNTTKFSGKKLVVKPGSTFISMDNGVYNILVWKGKGKFDGHYIEAGNFECDELLVSYERAIKPIKIENTGKEELQIIKFFGPDINPDVPMIRGIESKVLGVF
ncbi:MAG: hypothetical protein H5T85_03440 [Actinobacteria bacterium]|nr:hypothetical protein [Actinomycetota bacterium]